VIIYLDFDGVLHPDAVYNPPNKPIELRGPGELFMHAHVLEEALAIYPEAKIILSTSWVRALGFDRTIKKMPPKLAARVTGATWHNKLRQDNYDPFSNMSRFKQIMNHVNKNAVENWIAIDDLHSGHEVYSWPKDQSHLLVLTEESKGLGCPKAQADLNKKLKEMKC
jgi:hypothetical protein